MEEKGSSEILPSSSWKGNRSNGAVAGFLAEFPTHPPSLSASSGCLSQTWCLPAAVLLVAGRNQSSKSPYTSQVVGDEGVVRQRPDLGEARGEKRSLGRCQRWRGRWSTNHP